MISRIFQKSAASRAGLKEGDILVSVNGATTRYLSLKKFMTTFQKKPSDTHAIFTIRRSAILARH